MTNIIIIAKREFVRAVKRPTFWIMTLFFPVFIIVISAISGLSSAGLEQKVSEELSSIKKISIIDNANLIDPKLVKPPIELNTDQNKELDRLKNDDIDVLIIYPSDFLKKKDTQVYSKDKGLFSNTNLTELSGTIIKQYIMSSLTATQSTIINSKFNSTVIIYKDGKFSNYSLGNLVVPIVLFFLYFILSFLSANFLLMSISEEKENRMIESILTLTTPKKLILGKLIGSIITVLFQLLILVVFFAIILTVAQTKLNLPIDLSQVVIDPWQLIIGLFYIIMGFLIMANIMIGAGAAAPTYKEASSLSSIFILLSVFPIYFVTAIISDPNGPLAMFGSYFPFTAPLVLLLRNALQNVSIAEGIFSGIVLIIYVLLAFFLAYKLFEFGSLETSQKISLKNFIASFRKK